MRKPTFLTFTIAMGLTLPALPQAIAGEKYKFAGTLGTEAPPGTMNAPGKVAVDASGDIFVADTGNNRIEKFDHPGKFL